MHRRAATKGEREKFLCHRSWPWISLSLSTVFTFAVINHILQHDYYSLAILSCKLPLGKTLARSTLCHCHMKIPSWSLKSRCLPPEALWSILVAALCLGPLTRIVTAGWNSVNPVSLKISTDGCSNPLDSSESSGPVGVTIASYSLRLKKPGGATCYKCLIADYSNSAETASFHNGLGRPSLNPKPASWLNMLFPL